MGGEMLQQGNITNICNHYLGRGYRLPSLAVELNGRMGGSLGRRGDYYGD
jgi:hypothetical protein